MISQVLVTKQTGPQGKAMSKVSPPNLIWNTPTIVDQGRRMLKSLDPLPIPHCTIPDPVRKDLDLINAHSNLIHSDSPGLDKLCSTLNPFRIKHVLLRIRKDFVLALEFCNWVELKRPNLHTLETNSMILHILTKSSKFKSAEGILKGIVNSCQLDLNPRQFDALVYSYRLCDSSSRVFDLLFKTYAHTKKFSVDFVREDNHERFSEKRRNRSLPTGQRKEPLSVTVLMQQKDTSERGEQSNDEKRTGKREGSFNLLDKRRGQWF